MRIKNKDLRIFGFIWALIFTFVAYKFSELLFGCAALGLVVVSLFCPQLFLKLKIYQGWIKLGNILGKINGFLISSILFFFVFVPMGLCLRLFKKDLLNKKLDSSADSYYIDRKLQPDSMKNQF